MDDEKKAILRERKRLAEDCLDHVKDAINAGLTDVALRGVDMAKRQIEHWNVE